jgi:hypothetical protein
MKNVVLCDVTTCLISSVLQLLVAANLVPRSVILFALMMEAIRSSGTSVLTRATRSPIPEEGVLRRTQSY